MKPNNYHLGQKIKEIVDKSSLKQADFARAINTSPQNVTTLFKRKSIDCELMVSICNVLHYNFFSDYIDMLDFSQSAIPQKQVIERNTSLWVNEQASEYFLPKVQQECKECELRERLLQAKDEVIESLRLVIDNFKQ